MDIGHTLAIPEFALPSAFSQKRPSLPVKTTSPKKKTSAQKDHIRKKKAKSQTASGPVEAYCICFPSSYIPKQLETESSGPIRFYG